VEKAVLVLNGVLSVAAVILAVVLFILP